MAATRLHPFGLYGIHFMCKTRCKNAPLRIFISRSNHVNEIDSRWLNFREIRGRADKSLARPTSQCRRTESIVSLERGICSCAEFQAFSCYRSWKEACQATRVISTTSRRNLSLSPPPARQGAEGNSRHSDRNIRETGTIVCHRQKLGGPV
jgi:hypothetical protein